MTYDFSVVSEQSRQHEKQSTSKPDQIDKWCFANSRNKTFKIIEIN